MAKSASKSKQAYQTQYKATSKWKSNRIRRLERAAKKFPNNQQIQEALANVGSYRRHTPTTQMWSHTQIATAKLFKKFCGTAPHSLFSSNPQTASAALQSLKGWIDPKSKLLPQGKVSFAIGDIAKITVVKPA